MLERRLFGAPGFNNIKVEFPILRDCLRGVAELSTLAK
jgi:hypothetical protein